jgi:hypothetical protein
VIFNGSVSCTLAATYEPQEGDPLDLDSMEQPAKEFRAKILRLAADSSDAD